MNENEYYFEEVYGPPEMLTGRRGACAPEDAPEDAPLPYPMNFQAEPGRGDDPPRPERVYEGPEYWASSKPVPPRPQNVYAGPPINDGTEPPAAKCVYAAPPIRDKKPEPPLPRCVYAGPEYFERRKPDVSITQELPAVTPPKSLSPDKTEEKKGFWQKLFGKGKG